MKKILLYILALIVTINLQAQFLTQSNNGKSTIPLPLKGLGVALDVGKSEVALGANNYQNVLNDKSKWLIGGNLSGKSAAGLASLFSSGEIVPQGDFQGFFGYSMSNGKKLIGKFEDSRLKLSIDQMNYSLDSLFSVYKIVMRQDIISSASEITDANEQLSTIKTLSTKLAKANDAMALKKVVTEFVPTESTKKFLDALKKAWNPHLAEYQQKATDIMDSKDRPLSDGQFNKYIDALNPWRLTIFAQGGISARGFTRYLGLNPTALSKSFQDTLFRGGNFGLGFNAQYKNYWLGVTYSYAKTDNFPALKSKEYTLRTVDTSRNQSLSSEKKITAYAGEYGRVETNQLNIDLVGDFRMNDTSRLLINPYLRSSLHSRNESLLPNITNIGLGAYFIGKKSSFLGGLYIELPDIDNNIEKAKPADDQNIRSPFKKLSFGIVTKFSIGSILNWNNRPAKPD